MCAINVVVRSGMLCLIIVEISIAWNNHKWSFIAENKAKTARIGGVETVVKIMNTHINNADICYKGLNTLLEMTTNSKANRPT